MIFTDIIIQRRFFEQIFRMSTLNENYFTQKFLDKNLLDEKMRITVQVCTITVKKYVYIIVQPQLSAVAGTKQKRSVNREFRQSRLHIN